MLPISVVIPLYNKGPHIARTINSVLAQTVTDFEIVVVDDGSTDNGTDIVASFNDPRIRLIMQQNQGVSAARNRGIREARSDFIAFLDADDEWTPDHLETLLRLRSKFPEAGAYTTAYVRVLPGGEILSSKFKAIPPAPWEGVIPDYFKAAALGDPPVCSSAVGIPKKVFDEVGLFKVGESRGEDLEMWARIAFLRGVCFSWKGGVMYWHDDQERACSKRNIQRIPMEDTIQHYLGKKETVPYYLRLYINTQRFRLIEDLVYNHRRKEAIKEFCNLSFSFSQIARYIKTAIKVVVPTKIIDILRRMKKIF